MEIYSGAFPEGSVYVCNKPSEVMKRVAKTLFGSGRNIIVDNCFPYLDLIDDLK